MANDLEQQLAALMNDPALMQKVTEAANRLGLSQPAAGSQTDSQMMRTLAGLAAQGGIDPHQKALLAALAPYLSKDRIHKLENAMRVARMTKMATSMISNSTSGR